jgi:hypothetical protein
MGEEALVEGGGALGAKRLLGLAGGAWLVGETRRATAKPLMLRCLREGGGSIIQVRGIIQLTAIKVEKVLVDIGVMLFVGWGYGCNGCGGLNQSHLFLGFGILTLLGLDFCLLAFLIVLFLL